MNMNRDNLVTVQTYSKESEARIASAHLESQGIATYLKHDDCGGALPPLDISLGIQLQVRTEDEQAAREILGSIEPKPELKPFSGNEKMVKRAMIIAVPIILLTILAVYLLSRDDKPITPPSDLYSLDTNGDNKADTFYHYRSNVLVRMEADRNYDGKIDAWWLYSANRLVSGEGDDNFDGKVDRWVIFKNDNEFTTKVDSDYNGKPDATIYFVHQLKSRVDWQPNGSAVVVKRELYENGVLKEELLDTNRSGRFNVKVVYDPFGNEVRRMDIKPEKR